VTWEIKRTAIDSTVNVNSVEIALSFS